MGVGRAFLWSSCVTEDRNAESLMIASVAHFPLAPLDVGYCWSRSKLINKSGFMQSFLM